MKTINRYLSFLLLVSMLFIGLTTKAANKWMRLVSDEHNITELSIPGTHNSGTWNYGAFWASKAGCQDLNVREQLNIGVRFLDIRVGLDKGIPKIWHGIAGQANVSLEPFLCDVLHFLWGNKSETVICLFRVEEGNNEDVGRKIEDILYKKDGALQHYLFDRNYFPSMKECRGKIIYWRGNYKASQRGMNVSWPDNTSGTTWIGNKEIGFCDHYKLDRFRKAEFLPKWFNWMVNNYFGITFASGYDTLVPYPRGYAIVVNPALEKYLKSTSGSMRNFGIVAVDFVNPHLSWCIWSQNFKPL